MEISNKLLTIKDVMQRLNVSRQTVYNLTVQGKIRCVKINKAVRYEQSEIENYIASALIEKIEA